MGKTFISLEKAEHVAWLLWPSKRISSSLMRDLWLYLNNKYDALQCVVCYTVNKDFRKFLEEHPSLPDIGRKEVVINKEGTVIFHEDYRYPGSGKIYSYNGKKSSKHLY